MKKYREELAGIAVIIALIALDAYKCPMSLLSGVPCPCCGMTRAWVTLLHGDMAGAFAYHPLFLVPLAALIGILVSLIRKKKPGKRTLDVIHIVTGAAFFVVYIVRFITGTSVQV